VAGHRPTWVERKVLRDIAPMVVRPSERPPRHLPAEAEQLGNIAPMVVRPWVRPPRLLQAATVHHAAMVVRPWLQMDSPRFVGLCSPRNAVQAGWGDPIGTAHLRRVSVWRRPVGRLVSPMRTRAFPEVWLPPLLRQGGLTVVPVQP